MNVPRTVAAAVLKLEQLGECESWTAFAMIGRYNAFRLIKARELAVDVNAAARMEAFKQLEYSCSGEQASEIWKRYPGRWQLTDKGRALAAQLRQATPS